LRGEIVPQQTHSERMASGCGLCCCPTARRCQNAVELKAAREKDRALIQSLQANGVDGPAHQQLRDQVARLTADLSASAKGRELAEAAALLLQQTLEETLNKLQQLQTRLQEAEAARQQSAQQIQQLQQQINSQQQQPPYAQQAQSYGYQSNPYPQQPLSRPPPQQQQQPQPQQQYSSYSYGSESGAAVPYLPPPSQATQSAPSGVPYAPYPAPPPVQSSGSYIPQQQVSYPAPPPLPPAPSEYRLPMPPPPPSQPHPAVAELVQLQSKYDALKRDYNALVNKYDVQKDSLRSSVESVASVKRDLQAERSQLADLRTELKRVSDRLRECEDALGRAERARDCEQAECTRVKEDVERQRRHTQGLADTLDRVREKSKAEARRSTQVQRTMAEQIDKLIDEKNQLAAQLMLFVEPGKSAAAGAAGLAGPVAAAVLPASRGAVPPLSPRSVARQLQAAQALAHKQRDTFSDELPALDDGSGVASFAPDFAKGEPPIKAEVSKAEPGAPAAVAAHADEPEEGEVQE